jgi:hypothetical protein
MKVTVFSAEISCSETERQTSLVVKLSLVRICNSVLLIFLVSAYQDMLSLSLVSKISSLLMLDVAFSPMLRLLDFYNVIMRYCVAKKAATQASMNSAFNGTYWNLAERYTDVTKTFFLCFFYSAICPSGYLLAFSAIFVNYFVDKYLLLRRWRVPPNFNSTISNANRYFQYLAVLSHACIAMYFYRNWPFECSVIVDPSEKELCEKQSSNSLILQGFSKRLDSTFSSEENRVFYIIILCLMIICALVIFYYFCFKVCITACDKCFNCLHEKLIQHNGQDTEEVSEKHFLDLKSPDWYFPRFPSCLEANSPALLSDYLVKYQQIAEKAEQTRTNDVDSKWRWPGQQTYPTTACNQLGKNCFQSSLMIEHEIFAEAEIESQNNSIPGHMIQNPNFSTGIPTGPTVGLYNSNQNQNVGVLANALH